MANDSLNFDVLAEDNIRTLKIPESNYKKPPCVIFTGYPGSGKTFLAGRLQEQFPFTVLKEKDIMSFLAPRATVFERGAVEVFELAYRSIDKLTSLGKACVYDGNVKTKEQRQLIKKIVEQSGGSYLLIYIKASRELCYSRVQKQNLGVTRGDEKGFILDKDYFEYEIATTQLPPIEEPHVVHLSESPESVSQIMAIVGKLVRNSQQY